MRKKSKTDGSCRKIILRLAAMPGYCLWLFNWLAISLLAFMLAAKLLGASTNISDTSSNQTLSLSVAAHNAADGILFILVSVFFWYLASRLAHRFVAQIARHQTARKSAVKFGGLLAGAFIMSAFLLAWRVAISPLLPITILTVIGCLSFWAETTLAQRWKLQNEL